MHLEFKVLFHVRGKSSSDNYLVFPEHYCSCQAFFYEVVGRSEAPYVSLEQVKSYEPHLYTAETAIDVVLPAVQAPDCSKTSRDLQEVPGCYSARPHSDRDPA